MTIKSSDIHPTLRALYSQKVISDLQIGDNPVTRQGNTSGCAMASFFFLGGIVLCYVNGWFGFISILMSPIAYPIQKAADIRKTSLMNVERIEMMQAVLPLVAKTEGERAYIAALLTVGATNLESFQGGKIVEALNELLEDYYSLNHSKEKVNGIIGNQHSSRLGHEQYTTEMKLKNTNDPILRRVLEQNRDMLDSQISDLQALELQANRIDHQQKAIINAMNAIKLTLGRSQAASLTLAAPDIERITKSAMQIKNETKALEGAIKEVMALGIQA